MLLTCTLLYRRAGSVRLLTKSDLPAGPDGALGRTAEQGELRTLLLLLSSRPVKGGVGGFCTECLLIHESVVRCAGLAERPCPRDRHGHGQLRWITLYRLRHYPRGHLSHGHPVCPTQRPCIPTARASTDVRHLLEALGVRGPAPADRRTVVESPQRASLHTLSILCLRR